MLTSSAVSVARPAARAWSPAALLLVLLLGHTLLWTWIGWTSRSNFDAPGDMVEAYVWAQGWQWGYYKHPPLAAWVVGLWFSVVPESQWGYSLLAAVNGAVGLAGLAVLAREFLPARWVVLAVALASLAPGVTTLAMRFNCNAVLISTWPWALALTVRLMRRGGSGVAIACGAAWAAAMLGKYFSGVLAASMLAIALWLPAWRARLPSRDAALAALAFALLFGPHLLWLAAQAEGPLHYARAATAHQGAGESVLRSLHFALSQVVFPVLAMVALGRALSGRARWRGLVAAAVSPLAPRNEPLWLLAMLPIVATMAATVATGARTASVWGLGMAAGLALLAACRARETGAEVDLGRLARTLAVIWLAAATASPLWWLARASLAAPAAAEPREELAVTAQALWREQAGTPLRWVSGTRVLAASVAFYAADHPGYWSLWNRTVETPWVHPDAPPTEGGIIVCAVEDEACLALAESWSADRRLVEVAKHSRGFVFAPRTYAIHLLPPRSWPSP
ncbi:MAG: glycosyltransferase family 39 protein [Rubrivivax sp.]